MTIEEKLEKAVEFIKQVSNAEFDVFSSKDVLEETDAYCNECCDIDLDVKYDLEYVHADVIEDLKDKAWHVLADITD